MQERSEPGFLWLFEEMLDPEIRTRIPEAASASGLHVALAAYGMALDEISPDSPSHPDLTFVRVDTDDDLLHFADINSLVRSPMECRSNPGEMGSAIPTCGVMKLTHTLEYTVENPYRPRLQFRPMVACFWPWLLHARICSARASEKQPSERPSTKGPGLRASNGQCSTRPRWDAPCTSGSATAKLRRSAFSL
ncbi:hypothetical protein ACVINI_006557 [Rhizobium beringeri]